MIMFGSFLPSLGLVWHYQVYSGRGSRHCYEINAQTGPNSGAAPSPPAVDSDAPAWLFPIDKLNESLPSWLRFGGEYRDRLEGPIGIGYKGTNDFFVLDRFRLNVAIQPNDWVKFYGGSTGLPYLFQSPHRQC
jgi:hypothetical protein